MSQLLRPLWEDIVNLKFNYLTFFTKVQSGVQQMQMSTCNWSTRWSTSFRKALDWTSQLAEDLSPMDSLRGFTCVPALFDGMGDICPDQATQQTA